MMAERPGPGAYKVVSSVGKQTDSAKPSAHVAAFPKADRFGGFGSTVIKSQSQGPKYKTDSSVGRQLTSNKRSAPSHSFGTSTRDHALKMYTVNTAKMN
jgi:hypothetical protein